MAATLSKDAQSPASAMPRDVQVVEIAPHTWMLRSRTWDRLKFEAEYAQQKGTTANSYLIRGERTVLIDPPGESFTAIYLQIICTQMNLGQLDDVVLHHVNPNRMHTLKALVELAPQVRIVCSKPAANALREAFPQWEHRLYTVREGDSLPIGQGHNLQFISVKTPRWPDGLCSYDTSTGILFTDKFYGAHVCGEEWADERWKTLDSDRRYYFECLHAPQLRQVETALDKLEAISATCLAPGHGPLVKFSLSRCRYDYRQWCQEQAKQSFRVVVLYASAYGNTTLLAGALAQALVEEGIAVETINCEFTSSEEITRAIAACDGFIIGSPTLGGHAPTQIQTALGIILSTASKTKLAGVFGSYGWSGEAVDLMEERLRNANYRLGFEPLRVRFSPTEDTLQQCKAAATSFVQGLRRQQKQRTAQPGVVETQTNRTEQAIGRIIGSLCVLTVQSQYPTTDTQPIHRGVLTSTVSQASFNPPGIMIAIDPQQYIHPQHREEHIQVGDRFTVNILKEGRNLRRHFAGGSLYSDLQPAVFADLATQTGHNGCLILKDALAYLECVVEVVMDCGDRWLVYATVEQGDVLESHGITAIQHRALFASTASTPVTSIPSALPTA
jgi:flavorubredoxin/flavin reductase (DIM6/NTAB) family NADH-FMN oxidoreductase RutF